MIYTILTGLIILLSKIRDKSYKPYFRLDRTVPVPKEDQIDSLYMSCCDCGLTHFILCENAISLTPVRPMKYKYKIRFGAKAWTEPNIALGRDALKIARSRKLVD